jgi:uncharacterized membrane-anchored protein
LFAIVSTGAGIAQLVIRVRQSGLTLLQLASPDIPADDIAAVSAAPGLAALSVSDTRTFALPSGGLVIPASAELLVTLNGNVPDSTISEILMVIEDE